MWPASNKVDNRRLVEKKKHKNDMCIVYLISFSAFRCGSQSICLYEQIHAIFCVIVTNQNMIFFL